MRKPKQILTPIQFVNPELILSPIDKFRNELIRKSLENNPSKSKGVRRLVLA